MALVRVVNGSGKLNSGRHMSLNEKQINSLILNKEYDRLDCLNREDRRVWRVLQSNLYQTDADIRWYSIEAVATIILGYWKLGRQEKVLNYLRSLVWSMSDESGQIGWSAPQTIAEIVIAIPKLGDPFINIMIDRAFHEPALIKGGLWGIGRLGHVAKQSVELFQDIILSSFKVNEPETLGLAAWAMGETGFSPSLPNLKILSSRQEPVRLYVPPFFLEKPLGRWAQEAIARIG
jgi:hypothetical protein